MNDYTWPSVYFAYFFFTICLVLAVFFFIRSLKDGYWSKDGEAIRYQVFEDKGGTDDRFLSSVTPCTTSKEVPHATR
jgi:hypothetical protein